ncbi:hypothetical protein QAO71_17650 (plasmid) [Halopseudomonas sp. SMJS2]|uniref:hypothetical protein n=1 Tax=Halopseudomonas sp. SMJS2 TaxID=3041098 RepID=UPI002452E65C|nr:hypothetical protein [Halopseudomonas sp. SMJS2]WGK63367.1 hypothetical protein QAO71_17650 [Halopseudomonas sp. SMJS2]
MKAIVVNTFDSILVASFTFMWKVLKKFDPRPLQTHFAMRDPANCIELHRVFSLPKEDAGNSTCRLGNNRMRSENNPNGLVSRGELVKIKNPANGKFVVLYASGAGSYRIPGDGVAMDYDAKVALGITKQEEVDLLVGPAGVSDREYFLMYLDSDKGSRSARALGWYIFIGGLMLPLWTSLFAGIGNFIGRMF